MDVYHVYVCSSCGNSGDHKMSTGSKAYEKEQTVGLYQFPVSLPYSISSLFASNCAGLHFAEWPGGQVSKEALTELTFVFRGK